MEMRERDVLIWLSHIGGVDRKIIERMSLYFGQLEELWTAKESHIIKAMNKDSIIVDRMMKNRNKGFYERILHTIEKNQVDILTIADKNYPEKLMNINDGPYVLYSRGKPNFSIPLIAIIGARKGTAYGKWVASQLAKALSQWEIGVVSGLALGIDTASHKGAIEGDGITIGVLGCGIDQCYPASNQGLMEKMLKKGCVLSEYCPGTPPLKHHFPLRNRIISGLSDGILVVEAGEKSGSLITVAYGLEQGKDIYAVPGNINNPLNKGTNRLIKEGAKLVTEVEDVLEELRLKYAIQNKEKERVVQRELSQLESRIYNMLNEEMLHIDMLAYKSGLSISELHSILTILEIKGFVHPMPGKIFTVSK